VTSWSPVLNEEVDAVYGVNVRVVPSGDKLNKSLLLGSAGQVVLTMHDPDNVTPRVVEVIVWPA
jgi:hypothetical protein